MGVRVLGNVGVALWVWVGGCVCVGCPPEAVWAVVMVIEARKVALTVPPWLVVIGAVCVVGGDWERVTSCVRDTAVVKVGGLESVRVGLGVCVTTAVRDSVGDTEWLALGVVVAAIDRVGIGELEWVAR